MSPSPTHGQHHAIVMGASMAGLLATRVLADRYQQVTLVDRDNFPPTGEQRRGVPQGRHTHGLLASGRQVLESLLPGISSQFIEAGAVQGDIGGEVRWFFEGACLCRFTSGMAGLLMSRPFLEGVIRTKVLCLPNVRTLEDSQIEGLVATDDNRCVTGIRVADKVLSADLVIDATGRGSQTPRWLEALGYPRPEEERVEIALGYTTRFFRRRYEDMNGDVATVIPPTPEGKRGGVMLAQEGDRWTVTLIAHFGNYAPTELAGFIEFARTLPAPYIYEVIRNAEPVSAPASARFPASVRHRYEKLDRFPEGYLVMGDAISSFNPIYGQGMSSAALQAVELARILDKGSDDLAQRFFTQAAKVVDIPWSIAAGNDLRMPEATGRRNAMTNFMNWYMAKLHKAAHHDPVLAWAFLQLTNLLASPPSVLHPRVVARVLRGNVRSSAAAPTSSLPSAP